jgi:hypothetical protein
MSIKQEEGCGSAVNGNHSWGHELRLESSLQLPRSARPTESVLGKVLQISGGK